jgi:hypothetical protein
MIQALGSYISVKEIESKGTGLFISDSVGLERVKIVSISKDNEYYVSQSEDFKIVEGSEVYIKVNRNNPKAYIQDGKDKVFFITLEDIVGVDTDTVKYNKTSDNVDCSNEKIEVKENN